MSFKDILLAATLSGCYPYVIRYRTSIKFRILFLSYVQLFCPIIKIKNLFNFYVNVRWQ